MTPASALSPAAAPLTDPLYYAANLATVVDWVLRQHRDLLSDGELARLEDFLALPLAERALLTRLVMRSRNLFRLSQLNYPEIAGPVGDRVALLAARSWLDADPPLAAADLLALYRKDELQGHFAAALAAQGLKKSARKSDLERALAEAYGDQRRPLGEWLDPGGDTVIALAEEALFARVRLMFFGNLRQDWSEFVITALGHQRYETVPLSRAFRAFQHRQEVDAYLTLHHWQMLLEAEHPPAELWDALPPADLDAALANPWLDHRRRRLVHRLGHALERAGDTDRALAAYDCAWTGESRIRLFRVLEKTAPADNFLPRLRQCHEDAPSAAERLLLGRLRKRLDPDFQPPRKAGKAWPTTVLRLPRRPELSVERQVCDHLASGGSPCFYVENTLFNGLLGLLLWPALYAPLPGAFFHPFQAGPADLYREDFVSRRQGLIDDCLASLADGGYRQRIRRCWREKQGISSPLIAWPALGEELLELALARIPAAHLAAIFRRLLADLARHRSGLPDLIRFAPDGGYELIEVKGPGDRLQDHQTLWLEFFAAEDILAQVCHVEWQ